MGAIGNPGASGFDEPAGYTLVHERGRVEQRHRLVCAQLGVGESFEALRKPG